MRVMSPDVIVTLGRTSSSGVRPCCRTSSSTFHVAPGFRPSGVELSSTVAQPPAERGGGQREQSDDRDGCGGRTSTAYAYRCYTARARRVPDRVCARMRAQMIVYHGTTVDCLEGIKALGLHPGTYVAPNIALARDYAYDRAITIGADSCVVFTLDVPDATVAPGRGLVVDRRAAAAAARLHPGVHPRDRRQRSARLPGGREVAERGPTPRAARRAWCGRARARRAWG